MQDRATSGRRSKVIVIMSDTLRRDHVNFYGDPAPWGRPGVAPEPFISTPNLDAFAMQSGMFERFYVSSYPTVPCRTDLFTGRSGFPLRGWQPLEPGDVILPEILDANGWTTQLIFDTPMLSQGSYNFDRGFSGWDFVRGQHGDRWITAPSHRDLPAPVRKLRTAAGTAQYLRNTAERRRESDWMCAQTVKRAMRWLDDNYRTEGFLLWVDMWDPHDPFDAPEHDLSRYVPAGYSGPRVVFPQYGRSDYLSDEELNFVRGSYAALVTLVDRWVGKLLEKVNVLGLDENTLVIYLTDHGHLFGDHGLEGKPTGQLGMLYEPTIRCPLLIRHPDGVGRGSRPKGIVQHTDVLPTILDFLGIGVPTEVTGRSLLPLLGDPEQRFRELAFSGRHSPFPGPARKNEDAVSFDGWAGPQGSAEPLTVTDEEWSFICPPNGERPVELYNLAEDPNQHHDVAAANERQVARMREALLDFLADSRAPASRTDLYRYAPRERAAPAKQSYPFLDAEDELFAIVDADGRYFAYETAREAEERLGPDMPAQQVQKTTFGALLAADPHSLIDLGQYYWASDLVAQRNSYLSSED